MKCPYCNQEHPEGTKFCPETVKKMPTIVGRTNKDCQNCGRNDLPVNYKLKFSTPSEAAEARI